MTSHSRQAHALSCLPEDVAPVAGWKFQPLSNATVWLRRGASASPYLGDALLDTPAGGQTRLDEAQGPDGRQQWLLLLGSA